jgi:hypothetical protein
MSNFIRDSRSPVRDLNVRPPEFEAAVPITHQRRSIGVHLASCFRSYNTVVISRGHAVA